MNWWDPLAREGIVQEKSPLHSHVKESWSIWVRISIVLAITIAFALVFKPVYYSQGNVAGALTVLPVVAAGWLLGLRAGILAGFLSIGLDIALFSTSDEGNILLAIGDDGVGIPECLDFRKTDTLGLKLVVALVRQIKGTIELPGERGEGTEFIIAFKG